MLKYTKDREANASSVAEGGVSAVAGITAAYLLAYAFFGDHQRSPSVNDSPCAGYGAAYIPKPWKGQLRGEKQIVKALRKYSCGITVGDVEPVSAV